MQPPCTRCSYYIYNGPNAQEYQPKWATRWLSSWQRQEPPGPEPLQQPALVMRLSQETCSQPQPRQPLEVLPRCPRSLAHSCPQWARCPPLPPWPEHAPPSPPGPLLKAGAWPQQRLALASRLPAPLTCFPPESVLP